MDQMEELVKAVLLGNIRRIQDLASAQIAVWESTPCLREQFLKQLVCNAPPENFRLCMVPPQRQPAVSAALESTLLSLAHVIACPVTTASILRLWEPQVQRLAKIALLAHT